MVAALYLILLQKPYYQDLNYTFVIATALLHGHPGITYSKPWLDELIPAAHGLYYSVFPLGAVVSVLPAAALTYFHLLGQYPVNAMVALTAAGGFWFSYGLTFVRTDFSTAKRIMLASWLVIGSWYFTNLLFAGAWQLALGLAVLGELGALYFSVVKRRPLVAGAFFALAYGNRTEILLTAPLFLAFLLALEWKHRQAWSDRLKATWPTVWRFGLVPAILGVLTMGYNYLRFSSPFDFGYARIPHILLEPWYRHGIFSLYAIGGNMQAMLFQGWIRLPAWPYIVPYGFSGSIILASPFLFLLIHRPAGKRLYWVAAWIAIAGLTAALWLHGDTGGWQYSYRYAMELLPWVLLIFTQWLGPKIRWWEATLWAISVALSGWATYLFMWTTYVH